MAQSMSGGRLSRRLLASPLTSTGGGDGEPPNGAVNSDAVVILAALLCTLICLVGLGFMARCACRCRFLRRFGVGRGDDDGYDNVEANKGLKKKAIRALPIAAFDAGAGKSTECAICLSEFLTGEQVRILPRCGHCFHPSCIDTWLSSHSSCPSCRLLLSRKAAVPHPPPPPPPPTARRCQMCGLPENCSPAPVPHAADSGAAQSVDRESSAEKVSR
ncbi:unnamed protein product [Victoria cruziana]